MTNGEKLIEVFPSIGLYKKAHDGLQINFNSVWFNAEYKEPTTKNNLGVDYISRQEVLRLLASSIGKSNTYLQTEVLRMSSVTPQEPRKGHWEWLRCDMYICSECKNVYTDLSGIKDGMNYCPNCGSRNEVEE